MARPSSAELTMPAPSSNWMRSATWPALYSFAGSAGWSGRDREPDPRCPGELSTVRPHPAEASVTEPPSSSPSMASKVCSTVSAEESPTRSRVLAFNQQGESLRHDRNRRPLPGDDLQTHSAGTPRASTDSPTAPANPFAGLSRDQFGNLYGGTVGEEDRIPHDLGGVP